MGSRTEEVKSYVEPQIKAETSDIYAHLGMSLSDAVNVFLIKSIEVGGLPFDMRPEPKPCFAHSSVRTLSGVVIRPHKTVSLEEGSFGSFLLACGEALRP